MDVFINDIAVFFPNEPVDNDHIEDVLGRINEIPSRTKRRILQNNGIKTRYYAIDPSSGCLTHTNARMSAEAIRRLKPHPSFKLEDIECLCCGTSTPDALLPGHGLLVHGELKSLPCEVITTAGICISGVTAFKYGYLNVAAGASNNAVVTGSDLASYYIRAGFFKRNKSISNPDVENQPILAFEADFLRWMLSDGAGAVFLSNRKNEQGLSLKVEWIEILSFANQFDTCMYAGAVKNEDGSITGWQQLDSLDQALQNDFFPVKQDIKLLNAEIVKTAVDRALPVVMQKYDLKAKDVDWFLPHYSSEYFKDKLFERLAGIGFKIPYEKWFSNLISKGNTGAASIFVMMEELFHSGQLKRGEKLLCFIPESGRFSMSYMLLNVV